MVHTPPPPRGPGHRHRHSLSALSAASSQAKLEEALELVIPDAEDAAFVARCILGDGPAHHRAASWALLTVAAEIARRVGARPAPAGGDQPVSLPLPPHLRHGEDASFPVSLPLAPLRAVLERERDVEAMADALIDGPPHHALANAALVALLARVLDRLDEPEGEGT